MAKFCTNCGKELKEGEVCDCRKNSIVGDDFIKKTISLIKGMIYSPIDTISGFTGENNFNFSMILVGLLSILTGLFTIVLYKNGINYYLQLSYSRFNSIMSNSIQIPYMKIFFTSLVIVFCLSFVYCFILYLVNSIIFKRNCNFKEVYSMYGACSIVTSLGLLISSVLIFVNVGLGIIMFALSAILNMVYSYHGLMFLGDKNDNKYGYIYLTTNVLFYVVLFVISKIFS